MRLVLASGNPGKLGEMQSLFAPLGVELVSQGALDIAEADEPHLTFLENALAKARHAARAVGGATIADDSGLCVDALDGLPGVGSAHFADLPAAPEEAAATDREARRRIQDAANNRLLLDRLHGASDRRARFVATLVAVRRADDPEPLVAVGRWCGEVLSEPRGAGGFGYDPLLFIPSLDRTVAELDRATKNAFSHRALAARCLLDLMRRYWRLD